MQRTGKEGKRKFVGMGLFGGEFLDLCHIYKYIYVGDVLVAR